MRTGHWPATLVSEGLTVRPIRYRDRKQYERVRAANREWLTPWDASSPNATPPPATFRAMVSGLRAQARAGQTMPFVLTVNEGGHERLIGQLTVASIMFGSAMNASIGYWIDRAYAGRGLMPRAVALVTDYLFQQVGLHRVEINIRPENAPSLGVVRKLGFRDEGVRRAYLHINGAWADHRTFALLAGEIPEGVLERYELSQRPAAGQDPT